jgi:histidyl-tRNA synthetase
MSKLNVSAVSGTRDYLPIDIARRKWVFSKIEETYQKFGFQPLETPVMERLEILQGHYGDDEKLIFKVLKRGDKLQEQLKPGTALLEEDLADFGLRYDLTVPLARVVACHRQLLPRVFKRYQIAPVFRAERPAAGRLREFYQCDVDIVGSDSLVCEVELIQAAIESLQALGFNCQKDVRVKLNHRSLLTAIMESADIPESLQVPCLITLDKLDKIGMDGVRKELQARGISVAAIDKTFLILQTLQVDELSQVLKVLTQNLKSSPAQAKACADLETFATIVKDHPLLEQIRFDPTLARGLGYYTGCIFEIEINGFPSSCGGGGRYDNLIGQFLGEPITAVGISLGVERLLLVMEEKKMFPPDVRPGAQVMIALFDLEGIGPSLNLANSLRREGLRCDVFPETQKLAKQFKHAEKQGIPYVVMAGPDERAKGLWNLKDLSNGVQESLAEQDLIQRLQVGRV